MRKGYVWSLLVCLLGSFVCHAADPVAPPTKLAVVDVGPQEKLPPAFMDLMLVGLGNQPQLALLERTELTKLLREQALSLHMAEPVNSADAVKAGQLWAVDAFLMLEAGKPSDKKEIPVRVRLVDAHYGLKLWDGTILLSPNAAKYQESIDLVVKRSVQKLALLSHGAVGVVLVAVAPVRSEEISSRWDWLKDTLTIGIEQNIGVAPGFLLVERERTRSLTDERQVASGLPEVLRASAVFVDGSFKINREKGPDVVTLQLRCRRGGSTLLETAVDGTVTFEVAEAARTVTADLSLIRRVLQNLLSNALKYTPAGGAVRIVATAVPHAVRIAVTDTGPGIAAEQQERIFEKFGQIEDGKNRLGTSLGLTFCKLAVEGHGGHIGVESKVGAGSTFWLTLPRLTADRLAA